MFPVLVMKVVRILTALLFFGLSQAAQLEETIPCIGICFVICFPTNQTVNLTSLSIVSITSKSISQIFYRSAVHVAGYAVSFVHLYKSRYSTFTISKLINEHQRSFEYTSNSSSHSTTSRCKMVQHSDLRFIFLMPGPSQTGMNECLESSDGETLVVSIHGLGILNFVRVNQHCPGIINLSTVGNKSRTGAPNNMLKPLKYSIYLITYTINKNEIAHATSSSNLYSKINLHRMKGICSDAMPFEKEGASEDLVLDITKLERVLTKFQMQLALMERAQKPVKGTPKRKRKHNIHSNVRPRSMQYTIKNAKRIKNNNIVRTVRMKGKRNGRNRTKQKGVQKGKQKYNNNRQQAKQRSRETAVRKSRQQLILKARRKIKKPKRFKRPFYPRPKFVPSFKSSKPPQQNADVARYSLELFVFQQLEISQKNAGITSSVSILPYLQNSLRMSVDIAAAVKNNVLAYCGAMRCSARVMVWSTENVSEKIINNAINQLRARQGFRDVFIRTGEGTIKSKISNNRWEVEFPFKMEFGAYNE